MPELLRLADEVMASRTPLLLVSGDRPVALLAPVDSESVSRGRGKGRRKSSAADTLNNIIGIGESAEPTDVATHKHDYLADAYDHEPA